MSSWWQYRPPTDSRRPKDVVKNPGSEPAENCSQIYPYYTFQAFRNKDEDHNYLQLPGGKGWVEASHCERHYPDPVPASIHITSSRSSSDGSNYCCS